MQKPNRFTHHWISLVWLLCGSNAMAQSPPNVVNIPFPVYVEQGLERAQGRINRAHQNYRQQSRALADSATHRKQLHLLIDLIANRESSTPRMMRVLWNMLRGGGRAEQGMEESIRPDILPWLEKYGGELKRLLLTLEREYTAATEELAYHLGGYPGDLPSDLSDDMTTLQPRPDFSATLRRLGFDSAGLGVSLGFDVFSIKASSLALTVPAKIKGLLAGFFGRNAAVLAAGATAAAADGPFPVGDFIAVGGVVWTAYDLHASQGRYRRIFHESLIEAMEKARTAGHEQADELSLRMHRAYEKALKALADEARK